MGKKLKLKLFLGILKDKGSLIKATLSTKRKTASIRLAVIRATTRNSSQPPPDHRIAAILSHGRGTRPTASACIDAIMDRAHHSRNVYVVFKCLILLHNIMAKGSFILKDQLSFYPLAGGRNFLNLSRFSDKTDVQTWEFSSWVRWYAGFLELNLMTLRVLGSNIDKNSENLTALLNSDLLKETEALINIAEDICRAPENLINQQNNLIYEVMRLVGEDYRSTQHKITTRLIELGDRLDGLSSGELDGFLSCFKRLEECNEILVILFVNRKRNDAFWELISQTRMKIEEVKKEREDVLALTESTRMAKRVPAPSQLLVRLLPYGGKWLNVGRTNITVSTAMA